MPSQAQREANFNWSPNDNSSTTLNKYSQEVDHWVRAFKEAERKHRLRSIKEDLSVIGLVLQLVFSLIILIVLSFIEIIKWIRK